MEGHSIMSCLFPLKDGSKKTLDFFRSDGVNLDLKASFDDIKGGSFEATFIDLATQEVLPMLTVNRMCGIPIVADGMHAINLWEPYVVADNGQEWVIHFPGLENEVTIHLRVAIRLEPLEDIESYHCEEEEEGIISL